MADNIKVVQAQTFTLAGAGVSAGDTSMTLGSFNQIDGTALTLTNFGTKGFGTNEPASGVSEEQISFTGVVQNVDGTATLTGISSVSDVDPYTETSGFSTAHAGGTAFVISNTAGYQATLANKENDETITGQWLVPDPTVPTQIANKEYVDNIAIAGAPNASTSIQGLVQLATQAQYDAKTATGSTTAALVAPPNLNRATKYNDGVADTGTATAYAIAPSPTISAYSAYQEFTFIPSHTNTTSTPTLNVNGLGAKTIVNPDQSALIVGQILLNAVVQVMYDGTNFQLLSSQPSLPSDIQHTVNTIETQSTYYTFQAPIVGVGSASLPAGWSGGTLSSAVEDAGGYASISSAGGGFFIASRLPGTGSSNFYTSAAGKTIRIKFRAQFSIATSGHSSSIGMALSGGNIENDQTSVVDGLVRIVNNNSVLYAHTANGVTATATNITGSLTLNNWNLYEIIYTPGTNALFYANGALVATITTNLPTSTSTAILISIGGSSGDGIQITHPIVSIQN